VSSLLDYSRDNKGSSSQEQVVFKTALEKKTEKLGRNEEESSRWSGVTGVFLCFLRN